MTRMAIRPAVGFAAAHLRKSTPGDFSPSYITPVSATLGSHNQRGRPGANNVCLAYGHSQFKV